jgi:hypothetical protein
MHKRLPFWLHWSAMDTMASGFRSAHPNADGMWALSFLDGVVDLVNMRLGRFAPGVEEAGQAKASGSVSSVRRGMTA